MHKKIRQPFPEFPVLMVKLPELAAIIAVLKTGPASSVASYFRNFMEKA